MKKIALLLITLVIISTSINAQETKNSDSQPVKLTNYEKEIIYSDGYAYAESSCRYELSKLKLAKDQENSSLSNEMDTHKKLMYEVMNRAQEKYSELTLNNIYMSAFNDGKTKLSTCIKVNRLKAQNEVEKNPKK